jgi:hypothetical protein
MSYELSSSSHLFLTLQFLSFSWRNICDCVEAIENIKDSTSRANPTVHKKDSQSVQKTCVPGFLEICEPFTSCPE